MAPLHQELWPMGTKTPYFESVMKIFEAVVVEASNSEISLHFISMADRREHPGIIGGRSAKEITRAALLGEVTQEKSIEGLRRNWLQEWEEAVVNCQPDAVITECQKNIWSLATGTLVERTTWN